MPPFKSARGFPAEAESLETFRLSALKVSTPETPPLSNYHLEIQDDSLKISTPESGESSKSFKDKNVESLKVSGIESAETFSEIDIESFIESFEIDRLITQMRNWYRRRSSTVENMRKYQSGKRRLEKEGYSILEETDTKISITTTLSK